MQFIALATDYDGTLAHDGVVSDETLRALEKFRGSGRKLIMVTGRELNDLESVFDRLDLFDAAVVENGAVLYTPSTREKQVLADPPKPAFVEELKRQGVPVASGEVIVATFRPHEMAVLKVIGDLGLEMQVIFNKGSVMILPASVNKMSGLRCALDRLGLSRHNVVGVGDAENDHAFLTSCEVSVAVANALPAVKETADFTTRGDHSAGVVELIDMILENDLSDFLTETSRHAIPIAEGVAIRPVGTNLLVAGASGSGKSTFIAALLEQLIERDNQVCLIDPEGDYESFPGTLAVGDEKHAPSVDQVLQALQKPSSQVVVNFVGIPAPDRPEFFASLLPRLSDLRTRVGRPHWIVVDEAHHMLPQDLAPGMAEMANDLSNVVMITVHPDHVASAALQTVNMVVAIGPSAEKVIEGFSDMTGAKAPPMDRIDLESGEGLIFRRETGDVSRVRLIQSKVERKRHQRKYAHGELPEDRSFYFKGPQGKLNLRAQNLAMFEQMADGVDDETWLYHLQRGEYSQWFREMIKDDGLADEAAAVERDRSLNAKASREKIKEFVEKRYTAPA